MSCKNKKNKKKCPTEKADVRLAETVKKEAAKPAYIQDNENKEM